MLFFFGDHVLDVRRRELRSRGQIVAVEPQVFDLLVHLIENRDRVVSKDDLIASVWDGRIVSDSTLDSRVNAARKAIGDSGRDQMLIRTFARKGIRFVGEVQETVALPEAEALRADPFKQEISFCRSRDDVNIAFAKVGNGPALIKTANWLTHLEYDWDSPVWMPLLRRLAQNNRLIRYDSRGNGLSDRTVADISFDRFVDDFEAVVNAVNAERFAIFGISQGAAVAIDYAVRNPDRVTKLVLYGGYALGRNKRGCPAEIEKAKIFCAMLKLGWGDERSAFMRAFSSMAIPNGSPEQIRWFADLQRITTNPDNALRIRAACDDIDVSELLPKISVPTLVLHSRHDNVVPVQQGRLLATSIPNARFVTLESDNHVLLAGEPDWARSINEIEAFLAS